jgi:peroxiredoxin
MAVAEGDHQEESLEAEFDETAGEEFWPPPPFQLGRATAALLLTASGFGIYEYVLISFWSSPALGIYERVPWPAYLLLLAALILSLAAVRTALGMYSPHAKLGFSMLAFLACIAVGVGGGRFVSYTMRGTLNPPFTLALHEGDKFPDFSLKDQNDRTVAGPASADAGATLIYIYRGDFCPFSRFQLRQLTDRQSAFDRARVGIIAISADPIERSQFLARYLRTSIPLLSDTSESLLKPLGLVQTHRDGEPDNAIPAFVIVDHSGVVRWIYTSPYYRELPKPDDLLKAGSAVANGASAPAASH